MTAALIDNLHAVGSTCRELAAWCRCDGDLVEHCEQCILGGPNVCDGKVIKALVGVVIGSRRETNEVEQQKNYWQGVAERVAAAGMNLDRIKEF